MTNPTTQTRGGAVVFSVTYIGDLIQATLTFDAIARRTGARPTLVAAPAGEELLRGDPRLERVDVVRSSHPIVWRLETARHLLAARRRRAVVVNLELHPPRWRFVRRACRLLGLEAWALDLPALLRESAAAAAGSGDVGHVSAYYARAVGIDAPSAPSPRLFVSPDAAARVVERLGISGFNDGRPRLVVHPGSSAQSPAKRALPGRFTETLRGVLGDQPCAVVMVGSQEERALCEDIRQSIPGALVRNWAGELTVDELAALLAAADVFVGNDSGPNKIAEGVGTRTLSFWGPTSPRFIGPRGAGHVTCGFEEPVSTAVAGALALLGGGRTTRRTGGPA